MIAELRLAIQSAGVRLLDHTADGDHNRSVFTFAGRVANVEDAIMLAAAVALERIDLTRHEGVHPRIGALDVVPLVALDGTSDELCVDAAWRIGERLWARHELPVYFYGHAARNPERTGLESVRKLGFEALAREVRSARLLPDIGGPQLHPTAGAVCVGVRAFLVAFNVELRTEDLSIARKIARRVRESSGGLAGVKALGLPLAARNTVQVSMNITDIERTPLHRAVAAVAAAAADLGVEVVSGELIGLLPRKAAKATSAAALHLKSIEPGMIIEDLLDGE